MQSLSNISDGGHIEDLGVRYQSGFDPKVRKYQAYGPVRTSVLALWPNDDVGQDIVTNADSLAQYSLAAWVAIKNRFFFNETDAADDPTFEGYIEDHTVDPGFDDAVSIGPDVLLQLDTEQYLDCNNNGNIEWATAPSVPQAFAESTVETFCNNVNNQNTDMFAVPNTADIILFLGAILQIDGPACTIALATYIDPGGDPASWERLIGFPANKLSVLVANVVNGPDSTADSNWADVIQQAAAGGKTVLGYMRTGYLGVSFQQSSKGANQVGGRDSEIPLHPGLRRETRELGGLEGYSWEELADMVINEREKCSMEQRMRQEVEEELKNLRQRYEEREDMWLKFLVTKQESKSCWTYW
ncbi:hypothetical protein BDZ45DRAFT_733128 [Acephala macrosclerotiorum]|nr:hypothetical protein BDZ45DRAFT_733128 [Acephala macrosclerotiorum]